MRNSWGSIEERSKLNASKEGTFTMTLQQCREFLNHVIIGRINDSYHSSVIQSKHRNGFYGSYSFTVAKQVNGILSVSQLDQRLFPTGSGYSYSPVRIILEKNVDGKSVYVNSSNLFLIQFTDRNSEILISMWPWKPDSIRFMSSPIGTKRSMTILSHFMEVKL